MPSSSANRRDDADPVLEVLPHLLFGILAAVGQRHRLRLLIVEGRGDRVVTYLLRRGAPYPGRHPVVAEDRDARPGDVADCVDHVLDLLVAFGPAQHDVVVEANGHVLDGRELWPVLLDVQAQADQIAELPSPSVAGKAQCIKEHIGGAELGAETQVLRRGILELAETRSHMCSSERGLVSI